MPRQKRLSDVLKVIYEEKRRKNAAFSMRSYAKLLAIAPSTLHELMSDKKSASDRILLKIGKALGFSESERSYFEALSRARRSRSAGKRSELLKQAARYDTRFELLSDDEFKSLSSWHIFAVMELVKTQNFLNDPKQIARRLAITPPQAHDALHVLTVFGIIETDSETGKIRILREFVALPSGPPMPAALNVHGQFLDKAKQAMLSQSVEVRNFSTLVLKFRKSELKKVDEKIRIFRREFSEEFESGKDHDSVYALAVQFFRLDQD